MYGILLALDILVSILLIIVVLMQSSKGGGLAGSFGGGTMGTVFGARRTADFLSRSTWMLAGIFVGLCLIINIFFLPGKKEGTESIIQRGGSPTSIPRAVPPRPVQQAIPSQQQPQGK
jgi:preprotein translocase subunit SecG